MHRFEGAWEALPELHEARGDVAAAVKGSVLYALGGTNQRGEATTAVESLDLWTRAWRASELTALMQCLRNVDAHTRIYVMMICLCETRILIYIIVYIYLFTS